MRDKNYACGVRFWHPEWLQKYATTKWFLGIYGLLGTVQAMSYMYFIVTLTTIERRFHMPSQTTGIVLSGNEISQILLSLILSYVGGQRNRPLWIAWGMVFCGLSCFILALPHLLYGLGDDAFHLTKEYFDIVGTKAHAVLGNSTGIIPKKAEDRGLCKATVDEEECENIVKIVPLLLIFLSQFILGIGNTLYYSLGQTYLDDNTKKKNTPLMLAYAMALRMIGPIFGFFLGYVALNMFIDPSKTPLIDRNDPRWLGAWWFGWILLGTAMLMFSGLIALFPKKLPKAKAMLYDSHHPRILLAEESKNLNGDLEIDTRSPPKDDPPKLKDLPKALGRLLKNRLIIFNNFAAIFYILGASGYMTFMARYMEVQFHRSSQSATIVVGPLTIGAMLTGLLLSGWVISKKRPSASKVLFWNVIVACVYMCGQFSYMFFYCGDTRTMMQDGVFNLTSTCNRDCHCDKATYSPVCHEPTGRTFFSPCHAGCQSWNKAENTYSDCTCALPEYSNLPTTPPSFAQIGTIHQEIKTFAPGSKQTTPKFFNPSVKPTSSTPASSFFDTLTAGACLEGCTWAFYGFTMLSLLVHWVGSSGRIGNVLVNYRAVSPEDKSFAQGLTLMMLSLFAMIPGPIIFGRVIDSTCLVWNYQCGKRGDCQLYDQEAFRYSMNGLSLVLTGLGAIFDVLVWFHGRNLDLYGEADEARLKEMEEKNNSDNTRKLPIS